MFAETPTDAFAEAFAEMPQMDSRSQGRRYDGRYDRRYDIVVRGIFFGTTLAQGVSRERAEEYVREWNYAEAAESILPRRLFLRLARPPADAPARGVRGIAARLQRAWKARRFAVPSFAAVRRSLMRSPLLRAAAIRPLWSKPPKDRFSLVAPGSMEL
jgi:hypothetical protein